MPNNIAGLRCFQAMPTRAQHERAGRDGRRITPPRPALPPAYALAGVASGTGHLTRSRPQDSPSNAATPQWEPRKPMAGHMTKGQRTDLTLRGHAKLPAKRGAEKPGKEVGHRDLVMASAPGARARAATARPRLRWHSGVTRPEIAT